MSNLTDYFPDAICVVDASGNLKQSNMQFQKRFLSSPSELASDIIATSVNFVSDILHSKHRDRFFEALKILMSDRLIGSDANSVSLRYCMCYSKGTDNLCKKTRLSSTRNLQRKAMLFVLISQLSIKSNLNTIQFVTSSYLSQNNFCDANF